MTIDLEHAKKYLKKGFVGHTQNIFIWGGFLMLSILVYFFVSSGDFSFLLSYAALMRCFGFSLLNYKMWTSSSAKGVSVKSLEIYALTFLVRLISIMRHQGYLPYDKSGDWFYHTAEIMSFVFVAVAIFGIFGPLVATYDEKYDQFGNFKIPHEFGTVFLVVPCVVVAILFHPSLNREFLSDTCWCLSMYLEAGAMVPQIYMFQKQAGDHGGIVEAMIGHTMFAIGFSRIFELIFWVASFRELADHNGGRLPGYIVLLSQLGHMVVMGDFFYYYIKSISKGTPMELPVYSSASQMV